MLTADLRVLEKAIKMRDNKNRNKNLISTPAENLASSILQTEALTVLRNLKGSL